MSFIFNNGIGSTLNYLPGTANSHSDAVYYFVKLLIAAGWTHIASNNGTTASNTAGPGGDVITSAASMAGTHAYWFGKAPAVARGIGAPGNHIWGFRKHTTSQQQWSQIYVPANTNGTAQTISVNGTTTTIPQWTTYRAIRGILPDSASVTWPAGGATARYHMGADSEPPYGFYFLCSYATGFVSTAWAIADCVVPGTYNPLDIHPLVFSAGTANGGLFIGTDTFSNLSNADNAGNAVTFVRRGMTGERWQQVGPMNYSIGTAGVMVPAGIGRDIYGGDEADLDLPVYYACGGFSGASRITSETSLGQLSHVKGKSYMLGWRMGGYPSGFLLKRRFAGDRVVFGDITLPWDGNGVNPGTQITYTP